MRSLRVRKELKGWPDGGLGTGRCDRQLLGHGGRDHVDVMRRPDSAGRVEARRCWVPWTWVKCKGAGLTGAKPRVPVIRVVVSSVGRRTVLPVNPILDFDVIVGVLFPCAIEHGRMPSFVAVPYVHVMGAPTRATLRQLPLPRYCHRMIV